MIRREHPDGLGENVSGGTFGIAPGRVTDDTELAARLRAARAAATPGWVPLRADGARPPRRTATSSRGHARASPVARLAPTLALRLAARSVDDRRGGRVRAAVARPAGVFPRRAAEEPGVRVG